MASVAELTALANEYPKRQSFRDVHPLLLNEYFDKLNELDKKLFQGANNASMNFWQCFSIGQRTSRLNDTFG